MTTESPTLPLVASQDATPGVIVEVGPLAYLSGCLATLQSVNVELAECWGLFVGRYDEQSNMRD